MDSAAVLDEKQKKREEETRAFSLKDYELKINYLTNHFSRMWMRFNFFVTLEAALLGSRFLIGDGKLTPQVAGLGAALSLVWYWFGAEDRYLVLIYRQQVKDAAKNLGIASPYEHVGQVEGLEKYPSRIPLEWRSSFMSTTRLAALFPLLTFLAWLGTFIVLFRR